MDYGTGQFGGNQLDLLEHFPWELAEKPGMEMLILRENDFGLSNEDKKRLRELRETINIVY